MLGTALEFAQGTTDDCKRLVGHLFTPGEILGAYRAARQRFGTSDVVLVTAERDPSGFEAMPRGHYVARLRQGLRGGGKFVQSLGLAHKSAHEIATLPKDSDAFWLVVNRKDTLPVMVVLYAAPYATDADAREPSILAN